MSGRHRRDRIARNRSATGSRARSGGDGDCTALDEVKDRHACLSLSFETAALEQFAFERGKETFADGVIEAIAHRTHRGSYAGLAAALAEGDRSVLGEFKQSSQLLDRESCDDYSKAAVQIDAGEHGCDRRAGLQQPRNPLATDSDPLIGQLGVDARRAVGCARTFMNRMDPRARSERGLIRYP